MDWRKQRAFGRSLILLLGLAFCLFPRIKAFSEEKVRIGLSVRSVIFLPFYYARDQKVFARHALDVELIQMRSDLQMVGLVSGEIDYNPAIGPAILAIQNGMPLKAVGVFYNAPLFSLVSQSQIREPRELEETKVAVSRLGSESHRYGMLMLENSGVDVKRVTFIQTGSTTVSLAALQTGSVKAAILSPPFTGQMAQKGFKVLAKSRALVESPWLGLVTSRQKIQQKPEQITAVLRALREVLDSMVRDKAGVVSYVKQNFKVDEKVASESYEDIRGVLIASLLMPESRIKDYLDGAYRRKELLKPLQVSDVVDYSLLNRLK